MGFTLGTGAAAPLGAPNGVWIALLVLAGMCFVMAGRQHWREGEMVTSTRSLALTIAISKGQALLTEAAGLQPGDVGVDDALLRRAGDWVDDVSDALAEHDERDMQKRWMNNPRWAQERPDPITREQWDRYVVSEIRERLMLLSDFQHELRTRA